MAPQNDNGEDAKGKEVKETCGTSSGLISPRGPLPALSSSSFRAGIVCTAVGSRSGARGAMRMLAGIVVAVVAVLCIGSTARGAAPPAASASVHSHQRHEIAQSIVHAGSTVGGDVRRRAQDDVSTYEVTQPLGIRVVDSVTKRGVPCVELKTVSYISSYTDSGGWVAFNEPGFMDTDVWWTVSTDGYTFPDSVFG